MSRERAHDKHPHRLNLGDTHPLPLRGPGGSLVCTARTVLGVRRIAEAKASFECIVSQLVELGSPPNQNVVVFGEIVRFHVDEDVLDGTRINHQTLDAVGRMAGNGYATTRDRFDLIRPA